MTLVGRRAECEELDGLVADVRTGTSRVVVLRGDPGSGKTALLRYLTEQAEGFHIVSAVGVESEMELPYSGLHQLCRPMLDFLNDLPRPQHEALATVFGMAEGAPPNKFLVGIATLSLFAEKAEQQPLFCVVDDAHWLDQASVHVLGFVARRLLADRVGMAVAARAGMGDAILAGSPELLIGPLGDSDARALLLENLMGPLDAVVCDQIVAESHGNPLALLEFPRTWSAAGLAGGFGLPEGYSVTGRIEESYVRRLRALPDDTQLLVLAAAAEPLGDPVLLHSAAKALEIDMTAIDAAVDSGLLTVGRRVEFTHPLVRSSAYRSAMGEDRHRVHRALADATDAEHDDDRRAWHRASATSGPDEQVADDLERSAGSAKARGGIAAAAAFLQRAVELTEDPARRSARAVNAAEASFQAGTFEAALQFASIAEAGPTDGFLRARINLLRGHVTQARSYGTEAGPQLLEAARQLEPFDLDLARLSFLHAYANAHVAGHLGQEDVFRNICRAIEDLPRAPGMPGALDLLLEGLARMHTDGRATAIPILQRATTAIAELPQEDVLRWGWMGNVARQVTWDSVGSETIIERQARVVREAGALGELQIHLSTWAQEKAWNGDLGGAGLLIAQTESVAAATGSHLPAFAKLRVGAMRGREDEVVPLIESATEDGTAKGQGLVVRMAQLAAATLYNGLSRYDEAFSAAHQGAPSDMDPYPLTWILVELVEAATRIGETDAARLTLERLALATLPAGTDWALGTEARSRALLLDGNDAESGYLEAIARFGRTRLRPELARAHLVYGEWLRREGRRLDAREQLRIAYETFVEIGMEAFGERARRELNATGEKVRKRSPETSDKLTPQEEQIARLARDGFSNPEIGAQLFISARTVEWHLRKVFAKLDITSRRQLRTALRDEDRSAQRA